MKYRVLVVEPSENVATSVRAVLEEHDFAVDVIAHANEVDVDRLEPYAVLVLDLHRENRAAFALLERVNRETRHLAGRIVVISADDADAIVAELDLLGICGIVPKPIDAEKIVQTVFECLASEPS